MKSSLEIGTLKIIYLTSLFSKTRESGKISAKSAVMRSPQAPDLATFRRKNDLLEFAPRRPAASITDEPPLAGGGVNQGRILGELTAVSRRVMRRVRGRC